MEEIVNKVAGSGLISINLEDYLPKEPVEILDIKDFLFRGLILKEKEYRLALQQLNWDQYKNKHVVITCSVDAIIPVWAYMLPAVYLEPVAASITKGTKEEFIKRQLLKNMSAINPEDYRGGRIIIKGCGDVPVPEDAYLEITRLLRPVAKSILYGEACSNIPIFKNKAVS